MTSTPDDRESTRNLELIVDEIDRRADCTASLWYLRCADHQQPREGSRVVDSLRTWWPAAVLDTIGLRAPAAFLKGRRLRRWLGAIAPDVVILDDGLGMRVLDPLDAPVPLVVRLNDEPPEDSRLEPPPSSDGDLVLVPPTMTHELVDARVEVEYPYWDTVGKEFVDIAPRVVTRQALDLPTDGLLVVGWGDDGWLDGPDLFLRTLWALEHRYSVCVHGAWFGLTADPDEVRRLQSEAVRLGLEGRFHHRPGDSRIGRLCGDAVLLTHRSTADADGVRDAVMSGALVVAFEACSIADPVVRTVSDLDIERAAEAVASGLSEDRTERWRGYRRRVDVELLADEIVRLAR